MLWMYLIVAISCSAVIGVFIHYCHPNKTILALAILLTFTTGTYFAKHYVVPYYFAHTYAESLKTSHPLMHLIAENAPQDFQFHIQQIERALASASDPERIYHDTNSFITMELTKNLSRASNESIYNYLAICLEINKRLQKIDPTYVLAIEYPDRFYKKTPLKSIHKIIDKALLAKLDRARQELYVTTLSHKINPLNLNEKFSANILFANIMTNLSAQYGRRTIIQTFANPADPRLDKQKAAEIIIAYYEAILAQGPHRAGMIYKILFLSP